MFSADPATVLRMTFSNITQSSRRLIASEPRQLCCSCSPITNELHPFFVAGFSAGASPVRFVVTSFRTLTGVPNALPSVAITIVPL